MDLLQGLVFPANGTKVFQEDWNFEQESKSNEQLNSRADTFTEGIVSGGEVTNGAGQSINIQSLIAYDIQAKRIFSPLISNEAVPLNATSKVVIRHKFEIENIVQPDSTFLEYQKNSYELFFRTGILLSGDIALFEISNNAGVTTILDDLRVFRKVKDISIVNKTNIAESLRGIAVGRLEYRADNSKLILPKHNYYDVNGKMVQIKNNTIIDFSLLANLLRSDGLSISSIVEIQNKHLYVLLDENSNLKARIISDSEMELGTHSFLDNCKLCEDYYTNSINKFDNNRNGYYIGANRIIAVIRVNSANGIDFKYELGLGRSFMDTQHLAIGQKFTELRWKREHPACYVPDGSTISNMNLEAPELFRILGSNVLPDWTDRFGRNIGLAGSRELRDLQEDAIHGFGLSSITESTLVVGSGFMSGGGSYNASGSVSVSVPTDIGFGTPHFDFETRGKNYAESVQIVRG